MQLIPVGTLCSIEKALEIQFKRIPIKATRSTDHMSTIESNAILYNINKEEVKKLTEEKELKKINKAAKLNELLAHLTIKVQVDKLNNAKNEIMAICVLLLISNNFQSNPDILQVISSELSKVLLNSNSLTHSAAGLVLIQVLYFRQKLQRQTEYIFKEEYYEQNKNMTFDTEERYCKVQLSKDLKNLHNIHDDELIYIDRIHHGWLCIPPYIKIYKQRGSHDGNEDLLEKMLRDPEFVENLLQQYVKEHEDQEEKDSILIPSRYLEKYENGQNGSLSYLYKLIATFFQPNYCFRSELFNPIQAGFFQSLFEFYGMYDFY